MSPPRYSNRFPDRMLNYLHPHEEPQYLSRPHLAMLRSELTIWAGAVVFCIGAFRLHIPLIGGIALVVASLLLATKAVPWWNTCYAITDKRVLMLTSIVSDKLVDVPTKLVIDVKFERTPLGHLLDYGDFELNLSGRPSLRDFRYVRQPKHVYWLLTHARVGNGGSWPPPSGDGVRNMVASEIRRQRTGSGPARCDGCPTAQWTREAEA